MQPVKYVLVFILQDEFNMDKSKLNWGLMLGIYPAVWPDRRYDLAGTWYFIDDKADYKPDCKPADSYKPDCKPADSYKQDCKAADC